MHCCTRSQANNQYSQIINKLEVKGDGLGADYYQDPDGTMVSQPKKYIEKLKETYVRLFNTEPSKSLKTPL